MKALFLLFVLAISAQAQNAAAPARMIVSAEGQHGAQPPAISRDDVMIYHDKDRLPVTGLTPIRTLGLQLWILIDDGTDSSIGTQFGDLRKFILAQPANFEIGLGYMRNGGVNIAQSRTSDHALVAKALRLPLGEPGISASPYTTLVELIHGWPATERAREVFMISSGIDVLYGPGPENPYLLNAIAEAQRAGIVVSSIYFGSAGHLGHSYWQINWGQNNLSRLADETGGEFYWQGTSNPVSFSPYLDQFSQHLNQQYQVTFQAACTPELESVKVRTELPHVSLMAPARIGVPSCSGR